MIKGFVFILTALLTASSSWAADQDLVSRFVLSINQTLQETNAGLNAAGETPYCEQLRPEQVSWIASNILNMQSKTAADPTYQNLNAISVDDFVLSVADQLMCYPINCPNQGRASLAGVLCNQSSYRKDMSLLYNSISRMAGRPVPGYVSVGSAFGLPAR